ncbi:MAG: COG4223 family protein [Rhodospirillales bacterium]
MGPEEKNPEDQGVEGKAGATQPEPHAREEGEPAAGATAGDPLAGRTGAVAGEVPAGLGRVEPEPVAEPEPEPVRPASAEPVGPAAAEPARTAASPWKESQETERARPAAAAPPPPQPTPAPARVVEHKSGAGRGFLAGLLGSLLILGLAGATAFLTRDLWVPRLAASVAPANGAPAQAASGGDLGALRAEADALKADVAELKSQVGASNERLSGLEAKVDGVSQNVGAAPAPDGEGMPQPAAVAQPAVPDLSQPVAELDQRLGRLESDLQRLDRLEGDILRLAGMEQGLLGVQSAVSEVRSEVQTAVDKAEQQAGQPAATVLAVNQLADALNRSGGYARQLEAVRVIVGENANLTEPLDRLAAWADAGLATLGQLQGEFPAMAQQVAQTGYQSGGEGWIDDVTNRLTSLVTVRKVGDAALASGGADAALAQAETALKAGDLAGAVKALEGLQGAAAEAVSPWLTKARDRVAAEKALADLRLAAIAQLDAARG